MTPQSKKAKGRRFQQKVRDALLSHEPGGLFESTPMGLTGTDISDPLRICPWDYIECRNREAFPTLNAVIKEMQKCRSGQWAYTIKRNKSEAVWVLSDTVMQKLLSVWFENIQEEE